MSTGHWKWFVYSVAGLVVMAAMATGCADNSPAMRSISQHPEHDFVTLETNEGHDGVYFWGCRQSDEGLDCQRICDYGWSDGRVCAAELAGEFGEVSGPTSGVVAGRYRAQFRDTDVAEKGVKEEEEESRRRSRQRSDDEEESPAEDTASVEEEEEPVEEEDPVEEEEQSRKPASDEPTEDEEESVRDEDVGDEEEDEDEPEEVDEEEDPEETEVEPEPEEEDTGETEWWDE